jgi:hypothetical protein
MAVAGIDIYEVLKGAENGMKHFPYRKALIRLGICGFPPYTGIEG